jgi:VRR-NUC domain
VSAWGSGTLFSEWPPGQGVRAIAQAGAPSLAAEIFDRLLDANRRSFGGFFDVFAWREPGEVRFYEVKVGKDDINRNQRRFVERALGLHHRLEEFTIIEIPEPAARVLSR